MAQVDGIEDPRARSSRLSAIIDLTEAAYDFEVSEDRWLRSLLLRSAMEKLGIRTRVQLVQRMRAFQSLE